MSGCWDEVDEGVFYIRVYFLEWTRRKMVGGCYGDGEED